MMNYFYKSRIPILFVLLCGAWFLAACSPAAEDARLGDPTPVSALVTPTMITTATATLAPTIEVTPTATATATTDTAVVQPTSPAATCTNAATFIADVSIPDNSQLPPRTGFIKTWRVKNSGTCTWNNQYRIVHVGGSLLGAIDDSFALPARVDPGQTVDLNVSLVTPIGEGTYRSDWQLANQNGLRFGVGVHNSPLWVKLVVATPQPVEPGSISGFAWQDQDFDDQVEESEFLPNVSITLAQGANCGNALETVATDGNGRFQFTNLAAGNYCLVGADGTVSVSQSGLELAANQQLTDINVTWPPVWPDPAGISGWVWADGSGSTEADGMIQPDESYIAGVAVKLLSGSCVGDDIPAQLITQTSGAGNYSFEGLQPGVYCVFIDAAEASNTAVLGNGNWTFPAYDAGYHEITLITGEHANPVNFGWDYADGEN